jgi:RNA polymerase sigma factor (sigma-70 family)
MAPVCYLSAQPGVQVSMTSATPETSNDPREHPSRYLPLDRRTAALFLSDWESLVRAVLARLNVPEPEEALSCTFQKALRGLSGFRGESRLSTWLYRIAWREGMRQIQKAQRRQGRWAPLDSLDNRPDSAEDQLRTLERRETAATVRAALDQLPIRDKEVLALRYLDELPFAVVAQRLDISESAAKVRSHRALTRLRRLLEDHHE